MLNKYKRKSVTLKSYTSKNDTMIQALLFTGFSSRQHSTFRWFKTNQLKHQNRSHVTIRTKRHKPEREGYTKK